MATTKTLLSNLNSLLCNGCISAAEHKRIKSRIHREETAREEAAIESLGDFVSIKGSGAQTRYLFNGELPEVVEAMFELNGESVEDEAAES